MADSFFAELKRRNVYKVGVAYVAIAWILAEAASKLEETLNLPAWLDSVVVVLLLIGFPIALVFAWAFEITPDGIKKESDIAPEDSIAAHTGQKLNYIVIGLMAVAIVYLVYENRFTTEPEKAVATETVSEEPAVIEKLKHETEKPSIAVLPFVNMSSDPEQVYFSDGISEEILNALVKVEDLEVASRTSSFTFKGKDPNIPEIASILNVNYILEGSVRKSKNTLRITAQLIDATTDRHLWSETFDRELKEVFAIQDEIARAIVGSLKRTIGLESETGTLVNASTNNIEAFDLYLQTQHMVSSRENMAASIPLLERAVGLDPNYYEAWARLATVQAYLPGWDTSLDYEYFLSAADKSAERAISLNPDLPAAYVAKGAIAWARFDWESADKYYAKFSKYEDYIYIRMDMGYLSEVISLAQKMIDKTPQHRSAYYLLGLAELSAGQYENGIKHSQEAMILGRIDAQKFIANEALRMGNIDLWLRRIANKFNTEDQELYPLLRDIRELVTASNDKKEEKINRFWTIAEAKGFTRDSLLVPSPVSGNNRRLPSSILIFLGEFEDLAKSYEGVTPLFWAWTPYYQPFRRSEVFKEIIRNRNLLTYWQKNGFPDLCRPVGKDDFVCD